MCWLSFLLRIDHISPVPCGSNILGLNSWRFECEVLRLWVLLKWAAFCFMRRSAQFCRALCGQWFWHQFVFQSLCHAALDPTEAQSLGLEQWLTPYTYTAQRGRGTGTRAGSGTEPGDPLLQFFPVWDFSHTLLFLKSLFSCSPAWKDGASLAPTGADLTQNPERKVRGKKQEFSCTPWTTGPLFPAPLAFGETFSSSLSCHTVLWWWPPMGEENEEKKTLDSPSHSSFCWDFLSGSSGPRKEASLGGSFAYRLCAVLTSGQVWRPKERNKTKQKHTPKWGPFSRCGCPPWFTCCYLSFSVRELLFVFWTRFRARLQGASPFVTGAGTHLLLPTASLIPFSLRFPPHPPPSFSFLFFVCFPFLCGLRSEEQTRRTNSPLVAPGFHLKTLILFQIRSHSQVWK